MASLLRKLALGLLVVGPCISLADERKLAKPNAEVESGHGVGSEPVAFAKGGKFKMLYDARQRPQSVFLGGKVYIVYNGDAEPTESLKGRAYPMLISYDPAKRVFSKPMRLSKKNSSDHHFSPIIWADCENYLHVLFGCHRTPGTHLVSESRISGSAGPNSIGLNSTGPGSKGSIVSGSSVSDGNEQLRWREGAQIAPKLSYPTVFRISRDRDLIYYRTDGHTSSWSYRITEDRGKTWLGPERDVTDLDCKGRLDWSSYQTKLLSKDGKSLHVVYTDYDDNKHDPNPQRFFNPRYNGLASNEWKYNLSYLKIDLESREVRNADGKLLKTPIDIDYSKKHCEIWDTEWRGAGVPPAVALDANNNPAFLHVLSEDSLSEHQYYYVRRVGEAWKKTPITYANHQWNSCYLNLDAEGVLHAYIVTGENYLEGGYMDKHGGGRIEEWISRDEGDHWQKRREISSTQKTHSGWRFNNVQPIVRPNGSAVNGMLLFYGWKDKNAPEATAFLLHESTR